MPIRYQWSGWNADHGTGKITAFWLAAINSRYFHSVVRGDAHTTVGEHYKGNALDLSGSLCWEDYMERSSAYLLGAPGENDFNQVFAKEKEKAYLDLETYVSVAWMEPRTKPDFSGSFKYSSLLTPYLSPPSVRRSAQIFGLVNTPPPPDPSMVAIMEKRIRKAQDELMAKFYAPSTLLSKLGDK